MKIELPFISRFRFYPPTPFMATIFEGAQQDPGLKDEASALGYCTTTRGCLKYNQFISLGRAAVPGCPLITNTLFPWWHRRLACAAQAEACGYPNQAFESESVYGGPGGPPTKN